MQEERIKQVSSIVKSVHAMIQDDEANDRIVGITQIYKFLNQEKLLSLIKWSDSLAQLIFEVFLRLFTGYDRARKATEREVVCKLLDMPYDSATDPDWPGPVSTAALSEPQQPVVQDQEQPQPVVQDQEQPQQPVVQDQEQPQQPAQQEHVKGSKTHKKRTQSRRKRKATDGQVPDAPMESLGLESAEDRYLATAVRLSPFAKKRRVTPSSIILGL